VENLSKGERIRELRKEKGITQSEMAKLLHTTKQTISKYEKGIVTNIPSDRVEEMARILETTPEYILGWEQPKIEENNDLIVEVVVKMRTDENFSNAVAALLKAFEK
jgi:repressor LexA